MARVYGHLLIAKFIMNMRSTYFALFGNKGGDFGIVGDGGSVLGGGANKRHGETGVIGLRVIVDEAILQALL